MKSLTFRSLKRFIAPVCMLVLFAFFLACKKPQTPAGILTRDEMVKALTQVLVVEEKVNRLGVGSDSAYLVFSILRDKALQQSGTNDSTFRRSMAYYMEHPKVMEEIYTVLVDSLNLHEQRESVRPEK